MQNILLRFGLRHSLNFLLPKVNNYIGYNKPINYDDLDEGIIPIDRKFNILAHHSRYNCSTNRFLYEDTIRVTLLRDPSELFESLYQFYRLDMYYQMSLQQLLLSLPHANVSFVRKKRLKNGYNQMSFDLGLDMSIIVINETTIRNFIAFIDQEFHFVMINEYLDASLVILADIMNWPLYYVSYLPLMSRKKSSKQTLTRMDRLKLSQLNHVDTLLYNYFLQKFQKHVIYYGVSRLIEGIQKLFKLNEDLLERCVAKKDNRGFSYTISYVLKNVSDFECIYATKQELTFTNEIRNKQINRLKSIKRIYELVNRTKWS